MNTITHEHTFTQGLLSSLNKTLLAAWIGFAAWGEIVGRSRAAAELTRMGYHAEAKRLRTMPYAYNKDNEL